MNSRREEMSGLAGAIRKEFEVENLSGELLCEAADVLAEAFRTEETTVYYLDTDRAPVVLGMRILDEITLRLFREAGRPLLAAVEEGRVIGVGVIRDPRRRIRKRSALKLLLPSLHKILNAFARHPVRLARIVAASRRPRALREPFLTFEALGVQPAHQGKGVGRALMRHAQELARGDSGVSGIYLNTGSERNRAFYESLGYETLRVRDLGGVKVYHMFWPNPAGR